MQALILKLERRNNSVNGNPKYEIYFQDTKDGNFGHAITASDYSFCYGIENDIYSRDDPKVQAEITFSRAGRITGFKVTKKEF